MPPEARAHTEDGARAFARWFVDEMDRAYVSASAAGLKDRSLAECVNCQIVIDGVEEMEAKGGHQAGTATTIDFTNVLPGGSEDRVDIQLFCRGSAVSIVGPTGEVIGKTDSSKRALQAEVIWTDAEWRMKSLEVLKS